MVKQPPHRLPDRPSEGRRKLRSVRLTDAVWEAVQSEAEVRGVSASDVVDSVLRRVLRSRMLRKPVKPVILD